MANNIKNLLPNLTDEQKEEFYEHCSNKTTPNPENEPIRFAYFLKLWYYYNHMNKDNKNV